MPIKETSEGSVLARARRLVLAVLDVVPGARRVATEITRVEVIDRSLVIAAQALFSVTPLLVVVAAFAPNSVGTSVLDQISDVMGLKAHEDTVALNAAATAERVRAQTGLIGIVLVLISALSFARAFQRLFERVWEQPHRGGMPGNRRCLYWLVAWIAYLEILTLTLNSMRGSELAVVRVVIQLAISAALWWWTAHTLLLSRIGWRSLWLGAALTAIGLKVMALASNVVMPGYVGASVEQFGGLGLMFAASTWLLCFGGVIVMASILGRVAIEEPRLWPSTLRQRYWPKPEARKYLAQPHQLEASG